MIIINSPANPTGGVTPKEEVDKLVAGLLKHPHVALLSDEIYSQMLYGGRQHLSLLQYPNLLRYLRLWKYLNLRKLQIWKNSVKK